MGTGDLTVACQRDVVARPATDTDLVAVRERKDLLGPGDITPEQEGGRPASMMRFNSTAERACGAG